MGGAEDANGGTSRDGWRKRQQNDVIEESEGGEQTTAMLIGGTDRGSYWYWQMIKGVVGQRVLDALSIWWIS